MRRHGFNLIETLVVFGLLPAVVMIVGTLFLSFAKDMPHRLVEVEESTTLLHFLHTLEVDMHQAMAVTHWPHGPEDPLRIHTETGIWEYRLTAGQVQRSLVNTDQPPRIWHLPQAVIAWHSSHPYPEVMALAVETGIRQRASRQERIRFAQTRLLFAGLRDRQEEL